METLFGLPAHSLLIHAPIVLLPIAGVVSVALAVRARWRRSAGWWFPAGVFAIVAMVFAARQSGIAFDAALEGSVDVNRHENLANGTMILTILWFVAAVATVALDRRLDEPSVPANTSDASGLGVWRGSTVQTTGAVVAAGLAVLATIWLIRTGHEGADLVWRQTSERIFG
jgi:hypothetical protein